MKTAKNIITCFGISLACLLLASPAAYAMVAGRAQFVMGSVQITNAAGQTSALKKGDVVNEGDMLTSAKAASAQIRMQDGGYVAVRPDTKLKFDSFVFSGKEDGTEKSFFSLFKGGFRAVTGLIGRVNKPNYRITTPASTIGIRGTDHETYVVAPDSGFAPDVPKGTYNKVNVGETYMTTEKGTIFVKPNQMGFAGAADQMPVLQPLNINIFTVTDEPAPGESGKREDKKEDSEQVRESATVDNIAEHAEVHELVPSAGDFDTDEIIFPITTSDGTVLAGAATATEYAYLPVGVLIEISAPFFNMGWGNPMAAPSSLSYTGGGLSSYTDKEIVGGGSNTFSVIGGVSPITGAAISGSTGIGFGRWTSVTALQNTYTNLLGGKNGGAPTSWMYGPQGYLDAPITVGGQMFGTFSYVLDGNTAPYDRQSGRSGTLSSASLTADFALNTVSANLALTLGTQSWSVNAANMAIGGGQFFAGSLQSGAGSSPLGITAGTLTISKGTLCPTCFGSLSGAFTGQNYAGAILSYSLWDDNASGTVSGQAAFVRTTAITNLSPAAPTGKYVVATANGDGGAQIQTVDAITTDASGVLTAYSWGNAATPSMGYGSTTVTCITCTAAPAVTATVTGINYGTWDAGSLTGTYVSPLLGSFGTTGTPSPHWITGPESGPLFLPNALVGKKSFSFDGGMVTNLAGAAGSVLGTTSLTVDFSRQVVGINIDLSVPGTLSGSHTWNAKTVAGDEAIINGSRGIGGATFQASSYNGIGPGFLTVTMDGTTPGSGNVSGQLTGVGLNGAIMSYSLMGGTSSIEQVNGVAALAGATSDIATPHREVMMSLTDSTSVVPLPVIGFYANAPTRMVTDATGNLTQFDINTINNGGNNNASSTVTSGTSLLANAGNDPLTGISWGRWDGGSVDVTNRATGVVTPHVLAGSLHWIAGATETAAVTLPTTGTYTYVNAGGTVPTDNLGAAGTLNSATLVADFSAQTVQVGVNVTVGAATLDAAAANVPIIQKTAFYSDSAIPAGTAGHLTVTCAGTACGTSRQGTILGGFGGAGAAGATMVYGLQNISTASTQVISGVAAFHK